MAQWDNIESKGDVQDRRGSTGMAFGGVSLAGVALLVLLNYAQTGQVDVQTLAQQLEQLNMQPTQGESAEFAGVDPYEQFASTVLGSTTDTWREQFTALNRTYTPPQFVLFRDATESACGGAYSQVGPHYCPPDKTVYLDERFFDEMYDILGGSKGDVAQAYVIAHEVGHHVQTLLGIEKESVAMELQADCLAGVWAYSLKDDGVFEPGEIQEAMDAAAAVGDDHIQEVTQGEVSPETWTHGSSAERVAAFTKGYTNGTFSACK
jgi:predicted metalloprotease